MFSCFNCLCCSFPIESNLWDFVDGRDDGRSESSSVERTTWQRVSPSSVVERTTGPEDPSSGVEMTRRRAGPTSAVEKKTTSSRGVKVSFIHFPTKSSILTLTDSNITSFLLIRIWDFNVEHFFFVSEIWEVKVLDFN